MAMNCDLHETEALLRAGDLAALERIARCHCDYLQQVGRCCCRNEQEALDAVQDALLSAGEHLDGYRGDGSVAAWMGRIVANACHRMRRGRKNDPALHDAEADASLRSPSDPELEARRLELAAALADALTGLPRADRELVVMASVEGYTGPELARRLQLRPEAVRARLSRARRKLRDALEQHGVSREDVTLLP